MGLDHPDLLQQCERLTRVLGKLLTTPARLLKLVLPLTTVDMNSDRKDVAPLALLVHPQQPLSYLERLIQSELPTITNDKGEGRVPAVTFRAKEAKDDGIRPKKRKADDEDMEEDSSSDTLGDGSVQSYSGDGREGSGKDEGEFVKWSASTDIGDFIRDAARAKEFEVEIEGRSEPIKVGVPSFNDRTFYLRQKLRRTSSRISDMAKLKKECDAAAHKTGQRIALSGCGILVGYGLSSFHPFPMAHFRLLLFPMAYFRVHSCPHGSLATSSLPTCLSFDLIPHLSILSKFLY